MADDLDYTIRRSPRARHVRVRVEPDARVEVVLPQRASQREAALAIQELRAWIDRRIAEATAARERLKAPLGTVPFLGAHLRLHHEPGRTRVHRKGDELHVPAHDAHGALERWYRAEARTQIVPRLDAAT